MTTITNSSSPGSSVEKKVLEQTACPSCPSSDAFTVYLEGQKKTAYCFSCGYYSKDPDRDLLDPKGEAQYESGIPSDVEEFRVGVGTTGQNRSGLVASRRTSISNGVRSAKVVSLDEGLSHPVRPLPSRHINHSTCERYNVRVGVSPTDGETPIYTLFPLHKNGHLIGWKTKTPDKQYITTPGANDVDLFGQHLCKSSGRKLYITEGEEDALAVFQVLKEASTIPGWEPCVVSLPSGASSCSKCLTRNYDFVNQFEEVIIVFDNDEPGERARLEACKLFSGKSSYVQLPFKDANEMLIAGKQSELRWSLQTKAKRYQPDGIVNPADLWERYKDTSIIESLPYPDFLPELNYKTGGARFGSIVTVTSGSGCGKTEFLIKIMHHYLKTTNEKIGGIFIEQDVTETIRALVGTELKKRLQLPESEVSEEEEKQAFETLFSNDRVALYDYFGGMQDTNLISKLTYLAITGHKVIFLDHLSIIVSEFADQGGERERIDTLMTRLAKFVKEHNVLLFLVVHLVKTSGGLVPFEQGARPSLDDLRGSGSLKQLSWDVIALARNQQHHDPETARVAEILSLKCRHTGRTGVCDYIEFDDITGEYKNIPKPGNFHIRMKSNIEDIDEEF